MNPGITMNAVGIALRPLELWSRGAAARLLGLERAVHRARAASRPRWHAELRKISEAWLRPLHAGMAARNGVTAAR